jgi:hypothetical protein
MNAVFTGAVRAAIELSVANFHAVTDDLASAMCTARRHGVDRALEAIECTALASFDDLKGLIVVISTDITFSHRSSFLYTRNLANV